jgi:hypothetical protein
MHYGRNVSARNLIRLVLGLSLSAVLSGSALGQYGTGGGMGGSNGGVSTAPKGGYSSSTGIAIGAGAADGVGLAYLALHNHGTMVGCVEASSDGTKLMNEKDKNTYALVAGNDAVLAPGERVALKGKRTKDDSGKLSFEVHKLVKDYGSCKR